MSEATKLIGINFCLIGNFFFIKTAKLQQYIAYVGSVICMIPLRHET